MTGRKAPPKKNPGNRSVAGAPKVRNLGISQGLKRKDGMHAATARAGSGPAK